ncbi:Mitotic spindle checkpoint protein BUB3, WD repeat superfamily [Scheffersomyces stipitis CBS 6054]|uniref:Mitotic spindle checkpoint protein BUB3, WD repeat superfamily n=1 Tax=Scheffersomyces stipitis (strain ATCC 58785 / CBS 6054 / NBRC 10063 / NRRL Y-11545) TaxID=322104 RepID=A3LPB5_PICST|nr:Mitotic spindle checkpoint protein BUB3, WD repeat superfamily [Scheffersomyces stipitis CBS 6054]ABN64469.2 Mitotic spindle checkpoint protein BUB3, WD repeat superfamily [Scheffersomyces stipitis CBS 6054]
MAVELSSDQRRRTTGLLRGADLHFNESSYTDTNPSSDDHHQVLIPLPSSETEEGEANSNSIQSYHEFELNQSESLTFLYNLLYDENSHLSKADILSILNSLKIREDNLPFSIQSLVKTDSQGVSWPRGLRNKFYMDRVRVGKDNWFHNIPGSREEAIKHLSKKSYNLNTDFFKFDKFYSKLKLHITHFQLRNLICCGTNIANGIYYPSSYYHDHNLQTVQNNFLNSGSFPPPSSEEYHTFFKINRLMPDNRLSRRSRSMKLDCLIDSRDLPKNSNNRISTLTCTNKYLACGTFEGGFILSDVSDSDNVKTVGEYHLTSNSDGITNHIIIDERDSEIIVSSNDHSLRVFDIRTSQVSNNMVDLPFAINCASLSPSSPNELFVTGDHLNSFVIDTRMSQHNFENESQRFVGHCDYGFSCDWSSANENLLLTGNQDTTVRLWDKRNSDQSLYCWSGSLGSSDCHNGGPVRNCKFSHKGEYISWAESLDHIGIIQLEDLVTSSEESLQSRVQSIDFIGKCTGLNFAPIEGGHGEQLIIGVNDCPLGGILSYKLESKLKSLDFDFSF